MKGLVTSISVCISAIALLIGCQKDITIGPTQILEGFADTIYYSSAETGNSSIFRITGTTPQIICTDNDSDFWWVKVSPNRQKILCYKSSATNFYKFDDYNSSQLWLFNADGTNGKLLVSDGKFGWRAQGFAHWHPNGKDIIMAAELKDPENNNNWRWHLFAIDTMGGNPRQLTTRAAYFANPACSPTGDTLAYTAFPLDETSGNPFTTELFTAKLDTNTWKIVNETRITNNNYWEQSPHWAKDGKTVLFSQATKPTDVFSNINLAEYNITQGQINTLVIDNRAYQNAVYNKAQNAIYIQYRINGQTRYSIAKLSLGGGGLKDLVVNPDADIAYPIPY